jgi:hypothetical protein
MDTNFLQVRMQRLFSEGFIVLDISEALISFDAERDAVEVQKFMTEKNLALIGVRKEGVVAGYARRDELTGGKCADHMHTFNDKKILSATSSLPEVMGALSEKRYCFVSVLGKVGGIVSRADIQKPPVRMWLFGMITIIEMFMVRTIEKLYPNGSWQQEVSKGRLKKAEEILRERQRRNEHAQLIDCLQFSDKGYILIKDPGMRKDFGFESMRLAKRAVKDLESLRNNLAHTQDILTHNWAAIVTMATRLNKIMTRI